jgi:Tol biopolymer transport system component
VLPLSPVRARIRQLGPTQHGHLHRRCGRHQPKTAAPHPNLDYNASFSSDGRWIVFTSTRNGSADIYRVHPDGSGLARLTDNPAFDDQGALSPNGRTLAFVSSRSGQADIWVLELATGALRNLTSNAAGDFRPSWSPDGQWIAFSSDRDSKKPGFGFVTAQNVEIYIMRLDGSQVRQVTHSDVLAGSPAWSTDGKRLVYYEASGPDLGNITSPQRRRGTTQLVAIDLATSERQVLTTGPGEKWSPHWVADGSIGYVSGGPDGGVEFVSARLVRAARLGVRVGRRTVGGWFSTVTWKVLGLRS